MLSQENQKASEKEKHVAVKNMDYNVITSEICCLLKILQYSQSENCDTFPDCKM